MKKARVIGMIATTMVAAGAVLPTATAFAAGTSPKTPAIARTHYDGKGLVEVDFKNDVQYGTVNVSVKDSSGKSYTTRIVDRDDDELDFYINGYKSGKTYTFTISGLSAKGQTASVKLTDQVTIPSRNTTAVIEQAKYKGSGKVEVDFQSDVFYHKNLKVYVKDNTGKSYKTTILDRDRDELDFRIHGYKSGRTYTYTLSGIRAEGAVYKKVRGAISIPAVSTGKKVTLSQAKTIALKHAKLSANQVYFTEAKLTTDDGVKVYELEFQKGRVEYSYEIRVSDGKILDFNRDYDD